MPIYQVKKLVNKEVKALNQYQTGKIKPVATGRPHLDETLTGLLPGDIVVIAGASGCVDGDTEFFNGKQWIPISKYTKLDKVLQYNKEGDAELVYPEAYIKEKENIFFHIKSKYGVDQCLTAEHKVVYETSKGNLYSKSALDVVKNHINTIDGFKGRFYTTFEHSGNVQLDETYLRLAVAIQADGHYQSPHYYNSESKGYLVKILVKKQGKIERLESLLKAYGHTYIKKDISYRKGKEGFFEFRFYFPDYIKSFPEHWYQLSNKSKKIIFDEVKYWDSWIQPGNRMFRYFNNCKQSADFIQFVGSTLGYRSRITEDNHRKNTNYIVGFTKKNKVGIAGNTKADISYLEGHDGYKYCFTVASGMLVLRRNGCIFVTGNSGKTYELQTIRENIMDVDLNPFAKNYVFLDYSFEMKLFNLVLRGLNKHIGKPKKEILLEEFTDQEKELASRYLETLRDDRFYIEETVCTPEKFKAQTKAFLQLHKDKERVFVAIDHMALFKNSEGGKKDTIDAAGEAINELKREFNNVVFLLLSQLNRGILGRIADNDNNSAPNRSDLYQSDTMFHLADYLVVVQNPHRLGINEYMKIHPDRFQYLSEHLTEPTGRSRKVSFHTLGRIFYHVLKIREGEVVFNDIYIETVDSENLRAFQTEDVEVMNDDEFLKITFDEEDNNETF